MVCAAHTDGGDIRRVLARCDKTEHLYRVTPRIAIDCTGDSRLALQAGAELRVGRETQSEFNESLGRAQPDRQTLGSSILVHGHPQLLDEVVGNHQRLRRHRVDPNMAVEGIRLHLKSTNGAPIARIYEVRCYA